MDYEYRTDGLDLCISGYSHINELVIMINQDTEERAYISISIPIDEAVKLSDALTKWIEEQK